ncbi:TPA: hypothetical protein ACK3PA_006363 [Burkholderia cenocepacia]
MSTDSRTPFPPGVCLQMLFPGGPIRSVTGSEKLYREAAARRAFDAALGPVTVPLIDLFAEKPGQRRKLNRRRTSKRTFREPISARFVRRMVARINRGDELTAPMLAALAALGDFDANCSTDCASRPAFENGTRLAALEEGEVIRIAATEDAETSQLKDSSLTTLRFEATADLDWRSVVRQRAREIEEFRARGITLPPWVASEERAVSQSRSQEETHPSSRCAAWLRKVVRFLLRRSEPQSSNREKRV